MSTPNPRPYIQASNQADSSGTRHLVEKWPSGLTRTVIGLTCLLALVAWIGLLPAQAKTQAQATVCPMLLMDFECVRRNQRMEQASGDDERERILSEYHQLIEERRKSCRDLNAGDQRRARIETHLLSR